MQQSSNFTISQNKYQGPFEALVSLIEKRKLHISEISLAEIADEYIQFVRNQEFHLQEVSRFVVVAATLMLLKSRALLPQLPLSTEEEQDIEELQERLQLFSLFAELGKNISERFAKTISYKRIVKTKTPIVFRPDQSLDVEQLAQLAQQLVRVNPVKEKIPEKKVQKQRSLKEITQDIQQRISKYIEISFSEITRGKDKKETAASFLAVLELFRQGNVVLDQLQTFGAITVSSSQAEVPHYGVESVS